MIKIRKNNDRGYFDHGWLKTFHTFSFAEYHNPEYDGFHSLRVINEDIVEPGQGFPTHGHHDMEILTYILEGSLQHQDSMGNSSVIRPGEIQRMTAGTGVTHSEFNASDREPVHLLQIWIFPDKKGLRPGYAQKYFDSSDKTNRFRLIASREGEDGSITLNQDVRLYDSHFEAGHKQDFKLSNGRYAWVQVTSGAIRVNGKDLKQSDGMSVKDESRLSITTQKGGDFLLFDMG